MTAVAGISHRVAQEIAFRLGEPDACPADELALTSDSDRWRPWRAVALTHLWRTEERHRADPLVRGAA
jgi:3-methyladenine DNA glycosylase/8-oxoguanine DNA glycosylase